jgi:hypothetical protein
MQAPPAGGPPPPPLPVEGAGAGPRPGPGRTPEQEAAIFEEKVGPVIDRVDLAACMEKIGGLIRESSSTRLLIYILQ